MLTLESFFETPEGFKVFRDHANRRLFYYLPRPTIKVAREGDGLHFVAYSEDVTTNPNFSLTEDRAGGFLTLEVELVHPDGGLTLPSGGILDTLFGEPRFAPVPFIGGSCELILLASKGAAGGAADGFQVSIVGSTIPSLDKPNNAVFSARVGGKAAEVLWNTLGRGAPGRRDAQAAVLYSLDYLALQPAYHLEIDIDFKYSFEYWRHRVGFNALILQADLDFMIQEAINEGKITIREVNFQEGNSDSLIAGSALMALVRDLMSDQLFHPMPVPTPDTASLPDAASAALTGAGGLSTVGVTPGSSSTATSGTGGTSGTSGTGGTAAATAVTSGTFIKLTHTPVSRGTPGAATPVTVAVEITAPAHLSSLNLQWRRAGVGDFAAIAMTGPAATGDALAAGSYHAELPGQAEGTEVEYFIVAMGRAAAEGTDAAIRLPGAGADAALRFRSTTSTTATEAGGEQTAGTFLKLKHTPVAAQQLQDHVTRINAKVELTATPRVTSFELKWRRRGAATYTTVAMTGPTPADGGGLRAGDYHAEIPGQPADTQVEYYLEAKGRTDATADASTDQTVKLPADGDTAPITFRAVSQQALDEAATSSRNERANPVPTNASAGIGYSLRNIEASEQVKRTFDLTRTSTTRQRYTAGGAITGQNIGASFDPATHVTHVALGQGPFRLFQLQARAGFDFASAKVRSCKLHVDYPSAGGGAAAYTTSVEIALDATTPSGKAQFMANEAGDQTFDYWVEMVYDPDVVIGAASPTGFRTEVFSGQRERELMLSLDKHSPLLPVHVEAGLLSFSDTTLRQVQVQLSPAAGAEAHTIKLDATHASALRYIVPTNPADPTYHMRQTFFFRDDQATFDLPAQRTTQVVVNEPADLVFRMRPRLVDPSGLVEEVLLDASYTHTGGVIEQAVLHLTPAATSSDFTVLRGPADPSTWSGRPRFILRGREPVEAPSTLGYTSPEPLVGLTQAGLRVVYVELGEDPSVFTGDLRAIRIVLGANVDDATLPATSVLLRAGTTRAVAIVPGVAAGAAVSVATEVLRSGAAPTRTVTTLAGGSENVFVLLGPG